MVTGAAFGAGPQRGVVDLSGGQPVSQKPALPKLNLNAAQREQIRQALLTKQTQVEFKLKTTKAAQSFVPQVGAKLPRGIKPNGLPSELTKQIPKLSDYGYAKMKDQILLVNAMSGKIVEVIPEKNPQTAGQP